MSGVLLATAAEGLVGCRFRLHGREPATGLDCIGVLSVALKAIGRAVEFPSGYQLRTAEFPSLPQLARSHGFAVAEGTVQPGDVLFTRPGPAQLHLMIAGTTHPSFVEAHAGLGKVIVRRAEPDCTTLQRWRLLGPL